VAAAGERLAMSIEDWIQRWKLAQVFYDWQTLIAGVLALLAGFGTVEFAARDASMLPTWRARGRGPRRRLPPLRPWRIGSTPWRISADQGGGFGRSRRSPARRKSPLRKRVGVFCASASPPKVNLGRVSLSSLHFDAGHFLLV